MKTVLPLLALLTVSVSAQSGGPYTLDWSRIAGGGATLPATGGAYTLSGTTGQTDASPLFTGGPWSLTGGFWSFLTVLSVPDAPELTLRFTSAGTRAVLSWDVNTTGWHLEMSTDLHTWTAAPAAVSDTMSHHTITLPAVQRAWFRLAR